MFSHFSIGRKISLGFAVVILATIVAFYITNDTFVESRKINEEITNNHNPSIAKLEELKLLIVRSKMLINNWAYQATPAEFEDKVDLNDLTYTEYPQLKIELEKLAESWQDSSGTEITGLFSSIEELWGLHDFIKMTLSGIESYNEPTNTILAASMVEQAGEH